MAIVLDGTTGITTPDVDSTADISANGLTVGRGAGAVSTNTAVGASALAANTTGANNTAVGSNALDANTTGVTNVAVGVNALGANTTANDNVAVGVGALQISTTGAGNTAVGRDAGTGATGSFNTFVGQNAGAVSTGADGRNTFVGMNAGTTVTTGVKNTVLGRFNGNEGGLDIRTLSNFVVLSDGDGAPVFYIDPGAINRGINGAHFSAATTLGSSTNLNDIFKPGMYRVDGGASNTPTATFYALIVFGNNGNVTTQIATVLAGTATYVRSYNSSWSAWVQL